MRKGRDPEKPKQPASAYLLFAMDFRKKNQKLKGAEVLKKAGAEWRSMAASAKAKYEKEASKPKSVYDTELKKYVDSGRADLWVRDPNKPKRPHNALIQFAVESKLVGQELMKAWAAIDAKKKAAYEKKFQAEMAKYRKAKDKYNASGSEEKWKKKVGLKDIEDAIEEKALKEKEKAKAMKEKEKAKALKEKEKAKALKDKEKEKAKALKEKEKAKALKEKEKQKAKALKEKDQLKAKALKEKDQLKAMKEKEKAKAQKEKEMLKAKNLKLKQAAKPKTAGTKVKKAAKVTA